MMWNWGFILDSDLKMKVGLWVYMLVAEARPVESVSAVKAMQKGG